MNSVRIVIFRDERLGLFKLQKFPLKCINIKHDWVTYAN